MNCEDLHRCLDAYLAHTLDASAARALEDHLRTCGECSSVVALLQEPAPDSFALEVVARTTGSSCGKVRAALASKDPADHEDHRDPADAARAVELDAHLVECENCRAFAATLEWTLDRLPRLAAANVDSDFTADVLMATLARPSLWKVFALRIHDRLERWLERPLVAQEMAFAFTVLLVLLTSTPWSPLPGLPRRALDFLQFVPEVQASVPQSTQENWSLVQALPPLRYAARASEGLREDVSEVVTPRVERLARDLEWVGAGLGETGHGVVAGETEALREGLRTLGCGWSSLWVGLWVPTAPVEDDCAPLLPATRGDEDDEDDEGVER